MVHEISMRRARQQAVAVRRSVLLHLLVTGLVCATAHAQTRQWNAATDFSGSLNPSGQWTYGWSNTVTGPMSPMTLHGVVSGLDWWHRAPAPDAFPAVYHNGTSTTQFIDGLPNSAVAPGTLILHPGPSETNAVLRWTCPCSGWYQVTSNFKGNSSACGASSSTCDVHILTNTTEKYTGNIAGYLSTASSQLTLFLLAGDTLSIVIGNGPGDDISCDQISADVRVSELGLAASPWPMFQHDPQHTGRSPYFGPKTASLAWELPLPQPPGGVSIGPDGTIYVPFGLHSAQYSTGGLLAVNPNGTIKWSFDLPPTLGLAPGVTTPAVAADGTIYLHTGYYNIAGPSRLYAILPDGSLKWYYAINNGSPVFGATSISSPVIGDDGVIYVASNDHRLYALNPDGTLRWASALSNWGRVASALIAHDNTILSNDLATMFNYTKSGVLNWSTPFSQGTMQTSAAIGQSGRIYIPAWNSFVALNSFGGIAWSVPTGNAGPGPIVAIGADETTYLPNAIAPYLHAYTPGGTLKWTAFDYSSSCPPVVDAGGNIYTLSSFYLRAYNSSGTALFTVYPIPFSPPPRPNMALGADGTLYVPGGDAFMANPVLRAYSGASQSPAYQVNTQNASMLVDGVAGTSREPAVLNACVSSPVTLRIASTSMTSADVWMLGIAGGPSVPTGAGGVSTPYGIINIDLQSPAVLWFSGGNWNGTVQVTFDTPSIPLTATVQAVLLRSNGSPSVFLTQACQINVQ